ncbi:MAG: type VI secretion system protein TssA [Xanthomonadales bacterium]|jgi:type VI secretion system protein ImpA|nr:type VI secretion system protein TssA [Xanthomonadales bacterium]
MRLSAEELAQPVSDDLPCGEDLEYDPVFQQMEVMMQSTDEQEFGDTVIPGSGPDWKGVAQQVDDLNGRTRDLRVLAYGALADLSLKGLKVFSESLESLNNCMEAFWDNIHPELDVDDNNDATMRFNCLQILNDHEIVSVVLENAPLVEIKGLGAFSLRSIELAEGKASPIGEEEVHDISMIQGAFGDADTDALTALGEGVTGSIAELKRTTVLWDQFATDSQSLSIDETLRVLGEIQEAVTKYAPVAAAAFDDEDGDEAADEGTGAGSAPSVTGAINNRTDVVRIIDKICEYYATHEPSSPIPLLLRRAQRLVPKSFAEILEDIAPDGIAQMQLISGQSEYEE